jgi:hypothetical protein
MDVKDDDLIEFLEWLAEKGIQVVHRPSISVTEDPLQHFLKMRTESPGLTRKGDTAFAIWWGDFYVCDFGPYRLVYNAPKEAQP